MFEEELLKRVKYDQETGFFYWTNRPTKRADALLPNGYLMVRISVSNMRKGFMAHRVAWFSHHGRWPLGEIDHINKDKADNRIINLRECTRGQNVAAQWDRKRSLPRGVTNASHTNKVSNGHHHVQRRDVRPVRNLLPRTAERHSAERSQPVVVHGRTVLAGWQRADRV